ncbi:hypothetical protein BGX27_000632 [Mortierella sp. AM989]|nr:hypothetical protein BGX27_000632 [Mortierella sp. AM989]
MSQRKRASSSKFGHLFGDTSDNSSTSNNQGRLSGSGDLYRDPLAALVPPVTATTTTTRGGATAVRATLSPPPSISSASITANAATSSARSSPPGSGSNSRSSSRLQHHALFSSLTSSDSGGSSLFDPVGPASSTLSAAKRDLLFGEGASSSGSSSSSSLRRISTPPLPRTNNNTTSNTASSQQSSRVPTPPLGGTRITTTALDAEASPLGLPLGISGAGSSNRSQWKEDDILSIKSPQSGTEPLTRTSSQASIKSHESVKSSRSIRNQDVMEDTMKPVNVKPITTGHSAITSASTGPASPSSMRSTPKMSTTTVDHIFNPLTSNHSQSDDNAISRPASTSSVTSQSIETFQAISRSSSPITSSANVIFPPMPVSKSGFERERDGSSPPPISKSRAPVNVAILDDAAEAFAKDFLFSTGTSQLATTTPSTLRSSNFLDSGFSSSIMSSNTSSTVAGSIGSTTTTVSSIGTSIVNPGVGASAIGQTKSLSGFSLGEDVADSSNPWMNTLVDSMNQTKLNTVESTKTVYTQSDASGVDFMPEAAFTLSTSKDTSSTTATKATKTTISSRSTLTPLPSLDDDIGGFNEVFSTLGTGKSRSGTSLASTSSLHQSPAGLSSLPSLSQSSTGTSNWNVLDAAEAAAMDPDFMGPSSLVNQGTDKVLAMMQMPKVALDKDVSAQEVFDNPWE